MSARARKLGEVVCQTLTPDMHWYVLSLAFELAMRLPRAEHLNHCRSDHHRWGPMRQVHGISIVNSETPAGGRPCAYPESVCLPEEWLRAPDPLGRYLTPQWAIDLLVRHWPEDKRGGILLEPGCGDGRISRTLIRAGICDGATGVERDPNMVRMARALSEDNRFNVIHKDFLALPDMTGQTGSGDTEARFDASAQNPPYEPAEAFVRKTLANVREGAFCAVLLRLGWLAGLNRLPFWQGPGKQLERVIVLPRRPQFERPDGRKMGSDQTDYAWFGLQRGYSGRVQMIHPEVRG